MPVIRPPIGPIGIPPITPDPVRESLQSTAVWSIFWSSVGLVIVFAVMGAFWSAALGATAGLLSAWLQRACRVSSQFGLSFVESLVTSKFWTLAPEAAMAQVLLGTITGVVASGIVGTIGYPIGVYATAAVIGGGPPGGFGGSSPLGILLILIALMMIVGIVLYLLLNPIVARKVVDEVLLKIAEETKAGKVVEQAIEGAIEAVAGKMAALFLHMASPAEAIAVAKGPEFRARMLGPSAVEGAITGGLTALALILLGLAR